MNPYALPSIIAIVPNLILGLTVLSLNPRDRTTRWLGILSLGLACSGAALAGLHLSTTREQAVFWDRWSYAGFMPTFFAIMEYAFEVSGRSERQRESLLGIRVAVQRWVATAVLTFAWLTTLCTDWILAAPVYNETTGWEHGYGSGYWAFLLGITYVVCFIFCVLWRGVNAADTPVQRRFRLLCLVGLAGGLGSGAALGFVFPFLVGSTHAFSTLPALWAPTLLTYAQMRFQFETIEEFSRQTREALRQTEETSRTILEGIEDGYAELDPAGRFTRITDAFARIIGAAHDQIVGHSFREFAVAGSAERLAETYRQVWQTGSGVKEVEFIISTRDGTTKYLECSASLIKDAKGVPTGYRGIVRDATERKRAERELQEAKRIAEEASRAKGAFLATVSHELRTPLTSVLGFAKLIKKRLGDVIGPALAGADVKVERAVRQVSDNVDIIAAEGERLTALINDVLDLAKIESGKVEWHMAPVAVGEIVERAIAATTSLSSAKGLDIHTEIESPLPAVIADPDRLIQVVINLLSNAIKFTDTGSITCRARRTDGAVEVSVTDTGAGISPEDQPRVFEQFVQVGDTLTGKPKGTGLGLPICKQIIEHHGGGIWVDSEIGRGSTFAFTLPLERDVAEQVAAGVEPAYVELEQLLEQLPQRLGALAPPDGEARTVLIVDDDPSIRSLLRQELEASGHAVREARSGEEALAAVKQERPGLIILDVIMPGLSGFDVAAVLRNDPQTLNIPIIILSVAQDRERGLKLGVDQYFTKPMSTEALLHEVEALLARGPSKKKVLVVDEDAATVRTLSGALQAQGYSVVCAYSGPDGVARAMADQPDLVLVRSLLSERHGLVQTLRFQKGMEAVSFLLFE